MNDDTTADLPPAVEVDDDPEERLVRRLMDSMTPDSRVLTVELFATIVLAIAGVLTAWSALQSAKWSGEQAIHFSEAGANRTESTRFDGRATSMILLDGQTFLQWTSAVQAERTEAATTGDDPPDPTEFDPTDPTLSGYTFSLFREDFRPRVMAWAADGGVENPAGASPFAPFEDYVAESVPAAAEAARLSAIADGKAQEARDDNQNSDNYVVTIVVLASVLFFAGVSQKMRSTKSQNLLFGMAVLLLVWGIVRLVTLPIHAVP